MKLALIRHAQTHANIDRVWHGQTDTPLTDLGHEQAYYLSEYFEQIMEPHVIYSSPLIRAKNTASPIADKFNLKVNFEKDLMEFDVGEYEGETFDKLNNELKFFPRMLKDAHHTAPGGESRHGVTQRIVSCIERIATEHRGKNIAIVSHGMGLSFALMHWFGNKESKWNEYVKDNTSVTEITIDPVELIRFNQSEHLTGEIRTRSNLLSERLKRGKI